ncbi:hypothetical protein M8J77_001125 [Diaphorina citri]|nr:hypothetical protein M8J77_001125 [Diaphorina citri]
MCGITKVLDKHRDSPENVIPSESSGLIPCSYCDKKLKGQFNLRQHFFAKHSPDLLYECEICKARFKLSRYLNKHLHDAHPEAIKTERERKLIFKCDLCGNVLSSKHILQEHVRVVHMGLSRKYHYEYKPDGVCDVCGEYKKQLLQHKRLHFPLRPYACTQCDKTFKKKNHLTTHYRIHTGEKPYQCDICGRGFAQSNDMKKHRRTVHKAQIHAVVDKG